MERSLLIAWHDIRHQLRQGSTLLWLLVMPPIFFYFIGTVTGGFSGGLSGGDATPVVVAAENPGFLRDPIDRRLRENDFDPSWMAAAAPGATEADAAPPDRLLSFDDDLSERILAGETVEVRFETEASQLTREFESIRINRSLYTALADIVVAGARSGEPLNAAVIQALNAEPRVWRLDVRPAGKRKEIPTGFDQAVPGMLVMFTLLVLLTSGASLLATEREQGLLRRLASAPLSRTELVAGKWIGRMALAAIQIGIAMAFGTLMFRMHWGPDLGMVMLVLFAWGAFCASAGLLLGSLARTESQAAGLGVLLANVLAALGGCWWPIEITPDWMQFIQKLLPTGWTMDALHRLISFEAGAASALPHVAALLAGTLVVGWFAARKFRYQ